MSSKPPTPAQLAFRKELTDAMQRHVELPAIEMLAVLAHFVGQLIAFQDQSKFTSEQIMALVSSNVETGNKEAIASLLNAIPGGTA